MKRWGDIRHKSTAEQRARAKLAIEKLEAMIEEPENRIDIRAVIDELCGLLGLDKATVARLEFNPDTVVATVLKLDETGHKYVDPDDPTRPAQEIRKFKVRT